MKDFTMVTQPHWTVVFWLLIVTAVLVVVATSFIRKWAGDDGGDFIAVFIRIIFLAVTIPFLIIAVSSHGVWLKSGEYQGEFKVAKAEMNNDSGEFNRGATITLEDKNGVQQTFGRNASTTEMDGVKKGDKVILKVEMPFNKKPVWTKSIDEQGGVMLSIKKADN